LAILYISGWNFENGLSFVSYYFLRRELMSELDAEICSLYEETEHFLKSQSRNEAARNQPLTLRTEYKTSLKLTDSEKNIFEVDESFLSAFRDTYTDKSCNYIVRQIRWYASTTGSWKSNSKGRDAQESTSSVSQSLS
jgi:hypothetical protein